MRCLKSSMIDNKHWNMYLLYILLHSISPSIHPLFTIRSWSILTLSYSIIPTSVGLFPGHHPVDAYCLSIIYSCYFFIESMALAGFNWLPLLPCDISILVGATRMCVSTQSNFLWSAELLNQSRLSVPRKCWGECLYTILKRMTMSTLDPSNWLVFLFLPWDMRCLRVPCRCTPPWKHQL